VEALPPNASLEDLARDLARARSVAVPGTRYSYFNPGYSVLGLLVERVSGQSYGDYLAEHVFRPLGMTRTFTEPQAAQAAGIAQGHSQVFAFPIPFEQTFYRYELPAGFIISSASDLARYAMALTGGGALDGRRVLGPASVQLMFTPNRTLGSDYGFGWTIGRYYGETQITHGGDTERFHTAVVLLPDSGLSLVLLINDNHLLKDYNEYNALTWSVVGLVSGHPLPPEPISSTLYGWGLLGVWLGSLGLFGRRCARLGVWRQAARSWSPRRRWLDVGQHAGWVALTVLAVTVFGPGLLGRGFNWNWFVGFLPDVALVTMTLVAGDAGLMIAKLAALFVARYDSV
jgi:CubicO group peptidase (beta-lactamase class C family)